MNKRERLLALVENLHYNQVGGATLMFPIMVLDRLITANVTSHSNARALSLACLNGVGTP